MCGNVRKRQVFDRKKRRGTVAVRATWIMGLVR